ncbi:MAG: pectate lyase [Pirellulales bacterium]
MSIAPHASRAADKAAPASVSEVQQALRRATTFFRNDIATHGGYLWRYSDDLELRDGEIAATDSMIWVQPPGTPAVGETFLLAYVATGETAYLDAAHDAAGALVAGQLASGGWDYHIQFDPALRTEYAYRADASTTGRNISTLDDDTTQAAVRFLMHVDRALDFNDAAIHEAVLYALDHLVTAQYPNGAWPQRYEAPHADDDISLISASYPASWSREFRHEPYMRHYTLNDNVLSNMVATMLEAASIYGDSRYQSAAERSGDFLILAQMPEPQPAWAQQYDADMHPAWARKFEPPAVTGGESQTAMYTLLRLYEATGEVRFLEPLPAAIAYFCRSQLDDGRLARFYELQTNRPLYFTKDYQLTYDDADVPTHYAFKSSNKITKLSALYEKLARGEPDAVVRKPERSRIADGYQLAEQARAIVDQLDHRGRWVEAGDMRAPNPDRPVAHIIRSLTFSQNVAVLCRYLEQCNRTSDDGGGASDGQNTSAATAPR